MRKVKKVFIDTNMHYKEIMDMYGVSRATAYKAKKTGYLMVGCHDREVIINCRRMRKYLPVIFMVTEQTLIRKFPWIKNRADARSEAILRLLELSGHRDFGSVNWMITVVENTLRDWTKKERRALMVASDLDRHIHWENLPAEMILF